MSGNREVQRYRNSLTRKYDGRKDMGLVFVEGIAAVAVLLFIIFRFVIGISTVDGNSMYPTLKNGQRLLFLRLVKDYKTGDIISFRMPSGDYYVKRIIAAEGDTISVTDGMVFVNGQQLEEPYAEGITETQEETVDYPMTLGKNQYFVIGDNREHSIDSRSFGPIVVYQIRGEILGDYDKRWKGEK